MSSSGALYRPRRRKRELNLVPLIDVLVMLVFTAFITMQFKTIEVMNLQLPRAETAGKNEISESITISISKEGKYYLNNAVISEKEIDPTIKKLAEVRKGIAVLVRADETSQLQYAIKIMDVCRKYGLTKVHLELHDK